MNISLVDLGVVKPCKAAKVLHDVGHSLHSLPGALHDFAHVLPHVLEVELCREPADLLLGAGSAAAKPLRRLLVQSEYSSARIAKSRSSTARFVAMYASGLLISWATPAESIPSDASFSDCTTRARI